MLLQAIVDPFRPLLEDAEISSIAEEVFNGPFCLLAHDYFGVDDACYTYANKAALTMLSATWDDVIGSRSTLFEKTLSERTAKAGANQFMYFKGKIDIVDVLQDVFLDCQLK